MLVASQETVDGVLTRGRPKKTPTRTRETSKGWKGEGEEEEEEEGGGGGEEEEEVRVSIIFPSYHAERFSQEERPDPSR
jgi:hypothetical protein